MNVLGLFLNKLMKNNPHQFIKKTLPEEDGLDEKPHSLPKEKAEPLSKDREKEIERELSVIYENSDGSMPNMASFESAPRRGIVRALITLLLVSACFGTVAWFGFVVFAPRTGFDEARIVLAVSGDDKVAIGEEVHYRLRYENTDASPLAQGKLEVRFPEGFTMTTSSLPPTEEGNVWELGTISSGESGTIDVSGRVYGAYGESQSVRAFLTYLPATFSSPFQKVATFVSTLEESPVNVTLTVPESVSTGVEVPITMRVRRLSSGSIPNLRLEVLGETVRILSSDQKSDEAEGMRWTIPQDKEEFTVAAKAVFSRYDETTPGALLVQVVGWSDTARTNDPFIVTTTEKIIAFVDTAVRTTLVVNGASGSVSVTPGEALQTTLVIKNTGQAPMTNATLRLVFDAPSYKNRSMLNWQEVEDSLEGVVVGEQLSPVKRRGSITWSAKQIPALANLKPGEEITVNVNLPLKDTRDPDLTNYPTGPIIITPEIRYTSLGSQELLTGDARVLPVVSNVSLTTDVDQADRGAARDYKVKWIISNEFHDLKNLKLEADLYGNISWSEALLSVPAGTTTFDPQTKKLVWIIPEMPESVDVLALQFGFALNEKNSTQTQLISKIRFTATDAVANEQIIRVGDDVPLEQAE
jgi:hypothetical protein